MQGNSFWSNIVKGLIGRTLKVMNSPYRKANLSWIQVKLLKHLSTAKQRKHKIKAHDIYFINPIEFLHTVVDVFGTGIYNVNLPDNGYVLDCGANIGLGTIYLKDKNPTIKVIAFEPDEISYQLLQKNIASFRLQDVTTLKQAVWKEDTKLMFSNDGTMASHIATKEETSNITVEAVNLNKFLDRKVDFLKMDIEGAEYEVLKSIQSNLHFVQTFFLEYHGHFEENNKLNEMLQILTNSGFYYYIKEAISVYDSPFQYKQSRQGKMFDVQLNIFAFRAETV